VRLRLLLEADGPVHALSSGDVLGLHADFWNVWQPDRLGELTAWCVRGERPTNRLVAQCRPVSGAPAFG
jgi:hypothetical protein